MQTLRRDTSLKPSLYGEGNVALDPELFPMTTTNQATTDTDHSDLSLGGARPHLRARFRLGDPNAALLPVRYVAGCSTTSATHPTCVSIAASHVASLLPSRLPTLAKACILHLPCIWSTELPALIASSLQICNIISEDLLESVPSVVIAGPRRTIALDALQLPIMGELNCDGVEPFAIVWVCGRLVHVVEYELDETFGAVLQCACIGGGENYRPYIHYSDDELDAARVAAAAKPHDETGFTKARMLVYRGPGEHPSTL